MIPRVLLSVTTSCLQNIFSKYQKEYISSNMGIVRALKHKAWVSYSSLSSLNSMELRSITNTLFPYYSGLILCGGRDISTAIYHPKSSIANQDEHNEDCNEIILYKAAKERQIPILGICRGMQLINIAEGGTLYTDLSEISHPHCQHQILHDGWIPYHNINILEKSILFNVLDKKKQLMVSSCHHQAINKLGAGLCVSARASDGIIEAIESDNQWILGIQGHIEMQIDNEPIFMNIFNEFINQCLSYHEL